MDEIIEQNPVPSAHSADSTPRWRTYLETEQATRTVYLAFGFLAIVMIMWFLQFRTDAICCGDWDGYYHIRWSQLLWENFSQFKWLPEFKWLPLTVLNPQDYNDHHFLFHLLQIPFLWFFEPVTAAKVAAVVFSSLAIFSVYWLLYRYDVDHLLVWFAAILTCANMFYYRMNMAKAPPLTIVFTIAGIYFLFERRYVWLLPLMFAFVWTYSLFPLLWIAALIWVVIIAWNERKFEWPPLAYTTAGMVLGNVINPYFPANLSLFWEHFITKFKIGSDFAVSVGGEWYPYTGMELLTHFPVAMIAMLVGYILFMPRGGKLPEKATFFLMFVTILLAAQFRSKRFAEYFPPFAILFAAFSIQAFSRREKHELPDGLIREIDPYLYSDKTRATSEWWHVFKQAAVWTLGIVLIAVFFINMRGLQAFGIDYGGLIGTIHDNDRTDKYQNAAEWARDAIPEGERIFNANWDDFPKLFFHDTRHEYVYGLDPNYLYSENPDLYKLLTDITSAKIDEAGPQIRSKFGANYVFTDAKENEEMVAKLLDSGWAEIVYEDYQARILKIREEKGAAPTDEDAPETPEEKKQLDDEERSANANANAEPEDEEDQP